MFGFGKKKKKAQEQEQSKPPEKNASDEVALSLSVEENVSEVKKMFCNDDSLVIRSIENRNDGELKCNILYLDGMISNQIINDNIIRPVQLAENLHVSSDAVDTLMASILQSNDIKKTTDMDTIAEAITYGDTVLFVQGCGEALLLNTKSFTLRSVTEPESEKVLRGPREGFTESILVNLSMLRRRVRNKDLTMKFRVFGERTKTKACIVYIDGLAHQSIVDELEKRFDQFSIDSTLDVNYLIEMIKDARYSPFKTIGESERPDVIAGKLLEGRIAVVLDGTPCVITLPYLFIENIQNSEDYYVNFYYASFSRMLRLIGFFISTSVPALYIAIVSYHHEMLPTPLLMSIFMARQGVPLPTVLEAFGMIVIFQILAETGIRMPAGIGQALSIVGALVIGQAAVEAKFVSAPMIIVISITGITGLIIPKLSTATLMIRFAFLGMASFFGLYGFMFGTIGLLIHLLNIKSFGVPYLMGMTMDTALEMKDTFIRVPWWNMHCRPHLISRDKARMKINGDKNS